MKKEPLRMCIICRQSKPKKELIRIVKNKQNIISVDETYKLQGRGAYICKDITCIDKLQKQNRLVAVFETKNIDNSIYDELRGVLKKVD